MKAKVRRRSPIAKTLLDSSVAHMNAAIEFQNKPICQNRYEIVAELSIAAWEKALKAFLYKKKIQVFNADGTSKDFKYCLDAVRIQIGLSFNAVVENLNVLYEYRCKAVHFYGEPLDAILFALQAECVKQFANFLRQHFNRELLTGGETGIMPLGYQKPFAPEDFLATSSASFGASVEVKEFLKSINEAADRLSSLGVADSVLVQFKIALLSVKNVKTSDVIIGIDNSRSNETTLQIIRPVEGAIKISNDSNASVIRIGEAELIQAGFNLTYKDIQSFIKLSLPHVKQNIDFREVMRRLEDNPNLCRRRPNNPLKPTGNFMKLYSDLIYQELINIYPEPKQAAIESAIAAA